MKSKTSTLQIDPALTLFDELPDSAKVRVRVVAALEGCCTATVWRRVQFGLLPSPERIGNTTVWRVGDLRKTWAQRRSEGICSPSAQ
jgi:predicted DNA-binding transcriptional regulator AlpA